MSLQPRSGVDGVDCIRQRFPPSKPHVIHVKTEDLSAYKCLFFSKLTPYPPLFLTEE